MFWERRKKLDPCKGFALKLWIVLYSYTLSPFTPAAVVVPWWCLGVAMWLWWWCDASLVLLWCLCPCGTAIVPWCLQGAWVVSTTLRAWACCCTRCSLSHCHEGSCVISSTTPARTSTRSSRCALMSHMQYSTHTHHSWETVLPSPYRLLMKQNCANVLYLLVNDEGTKRSQHYKNSQHGQLCTEPCKLCWEAPDTCISKGFMLEKGQSGQCSSMIMRCHCKVLHYPVINMVLLSITGRRHQ